MESFADHDKQPADMDLHCFLRCPVESNYMMHFSAVHLCDFN